MDFQAIVRDQLGLMVSWIEGGNQVTVTRDSAGRPLLARAAGSRSKPYAAEFRYDQSGRFLGVRGEFVSVMFPLLLEEAARGGGGDVTATTGPGGGSRKRGTVVTTANGFSGLPAGRLQEMLSWVRPSHIPILDPAQFIDMTPITSGNVTASYAAGAGDFSSGAIRIVASAATPSTLINIPFPATLETNMDQPVRAGGCVHIRLRCSDWSKITRLALHLCEEGGTDKRQNCGLIGSDGKSRYGVADPQYADAWSNKYRTFSLASANWTPNGGPSPWGIYSVYYTLTSVAFTLVTSDAVTIDIDRVYSPEWPVGIVTPIFDHWQQSAREFAMREFLPRGWGAGGSGNKILSEPPLPTLNDLRQISDMGFDVFTHGHDVDGTGTPVPMTGSTTPARFSKILAQQRRAFLAAGVQHDGMRWHQWLQNNGTYAGSDMAGILRAHGIGAARANTSDAMWGVNPNVTTYTTVSTADVSTFLPYRGSYNRIATTLYQNIAQGGDYDSAPVNQASMTAQQRIAYAAMTHQPVTMYTHAITESPSEFDSSLRAAAGWVNHMEAEERLGNLLVLNPTTLEYLTFWRPGETFMRWDGEWVYRHDPTKIAF